MRPTIHRRPFIAGLLTLLATPLIQACGGSAAAPTPVPAKPTLPPTATQVPSPTAAPTSTPTAVPTATKTPVLDTSGQRIPENSLAMSSPDYAAQVFLWGNAATDRDLKLAKDAGLRWVKQSIEWRYVEPHVKGTFDWGEPDRVVAAVNAAGLKLVARVDNQPVWARSTNDFPVVGPPDKLSDFGDFLSAIAARYKGKIHAYEIWNEPNLAREWGNKQPDPKAYVEMLKVASKAIRAADPEAVVISAGLAPTTATGAVAMPDVEYVKQMYQAGLKGTVDMVGVHASGYKAPPEVSPADVAKDPKYNHGEGAAGRIYCFRHVEDIREVMVANGDAQRRVAIMEMGWTADPRPDSPYKWHSVTEEEKGKYLAGAFRYAKDNWQPWIGVGTVIYISDINWTKDNEQYYWSITNPDGTVRPSYQALQKALKS